MSDETQFDVAIVGGGVVGLACAFSLAGRGRSTVLLDQHARLGEETSTHTSGVIHAGIYYEAGSLKARLCVEGRERLCSQLRNWGIAHRITGKLIVATDDDAIPQLEALAARGAVNGVSDLRLIDAAEAKRFEPNVRARAALQSPSTGVLDVGEYLRALEARAVAQGTLVLTAANVISVERHREGVELVTASRGRLVARCVVNAAGLWADEVASLCGDNRHTIHPCRGEYAGVVPSRAGLIHGLVYPPPGRHGLGVHLTRTVHGELLLGPDARYIADKRDYESGRRAATDFLPEAQALCPALNAEDLRLGPSGIRPKRVGPSEPAADFFIETQPDDPRIIHLVGIESPGFTASPAIGEFVCDMAREALD